MKLALLRHGVTDWNLEKRVQGRIDRPLCQAGREQLTKLALPQAFYAYRWYCSPLLRARQSAELLGLSDFVVEQVLVEMNWGDWEGEILKPLRRKLGAIMRDNESRGLDFCPPGGESHRRPSRPRPPVWVSAQTGAGRDLLAGALTEHFHGTQVHGWLHLLPQAGRTRSSLYRIGQVMSEHVDEQGGYWLEICMAQRNIDKLIRETGADCTFHPADSVDFVAGTAQAS